MPFLALPSWQLWSVQPFLAAEDVERVIAPCPADVSGGRDRAVLPLLARLGLRAGDLAGLKLADIDWRNGRLAICGNGGRQQSSRLSRRPKHSLC
jgi:integrase